MTLDDIISQGQFRNGQTNSRGIRIATLRFGAFYLFLLIAIVFAFLSSVDEVSANLVVSVNVV